MPHTTLRDALDGIEQRFNVQFSYMDRNIDSLKVQIALTELSLEELLEQLERQTNLSFIPLGDTYISITPKPESKICGYLMDKEEDTPIEGALIFTQEGFSTSDPLGYFELTSDAKDVEIRIQHLSYEDRVLQIVGRQECIKVYLVPATNQLEEIVIQNYITRGIQKLENGEISVDVQETNILPGLTEPDVFFLLQKMPGIQSANETVSTINIRGGSNDQTLILWDGIRLYQAGHFFGLISAINPHIIDETTLIKNGTSASLGEGISGTIMMHTPDEVTDELNLKAGVNLINSNLLLDMPVGEGRVIIASRNSIERMVKTPTYNEYFDRAFRFSDVINDPNSEVINSDENFGFYDLSINTIYPLSPTSTIKGGFLNLNNSIDYRESDLVDSRVESRVSNLSQGTIAGYLSYDQRWSDRFKTRLYTSVMSYKQESLNFDVRTGQEHELDNEVLEMNFRMDGTWYLNKYLDFEGGLQLIETGILNFRNINLPAFRSLSKEVLRTSSAHLTAHSQIFSSTNLSLGIRASYFDKLNRYRTEPRLNLKTRLGGPFSFELLAELKSQTAVQVVDFQTDFLGVENRKWELVNRENIPLVTSGQVSCGINFQKPFLLITLEGYVKHVDGVITSSQGFLNQFQYIRSAGAYDTQGVELLINPRFGSLDSWISYAFLNSNYLFSELIPPHFRNNFDITHTLASGLTYRINGLELSAGMNFHSGLPYTSPTGINESDSEIIFSAPNSSTLKNYLRVDFSARYSFSLSERLHGNCGLSIWNLTDRDNFINTFTSVTSTGGLSQVSQRALGITPNLNLNLSYTMDYQDR